jgi:hypothetical protein
MGVLAVNSILFTDAWPHLGERERRIVAAAEAKRIGRGGITAVSEASGLSRVTITKGIAELSRPPLPKGRTRKKGAGRPAIQKSDPELKATLTALLEDSTRGDPESPLLWTCKSTRRLSDELTRKQHPVSHEKVAQLLKEDGYSLQGNKKTEEGNQHPDRDAQFRHINRRVKFALAHGQPVISVDTKKKELVGNYDNKGRQWRPGKAPRTVNGHDFPEPSVPRAYPYGVYDIGRNEGFVNIGTDHDTSAFAVASILGWWTEQGSCQYRDAKWLLITADGGGSNGYRRRQWKKELQRLSDAIGLPIRVCHFPPGTSKWNRIEHRLFSFISSNWRGEPLRDYETIVRLISATATSSGLSVRCRLDHSSYPTGQKITDGEMATVRLIPSRFHGEWNYSIRPHTTRYL